jgi:hypothetical protein
MSKRTDLAPDIKVGSLIYVVSSTEEDMQLFVGGTFRVIGQRGYENDPNNDVIFLDSPCYVRWSDGEWIPIGIKIYKELCQLK